MKKNKMLLWSLNLLFSGLTTFAQKGTEFWFAPPEVSSMITTFDGNPADRPIKLHLTSGNAATIVTISQPATTTGMPTQTVTINPNSTLTIDLSAWIDALETKTPDTTLNSGLKIVAPQPISAYYAVEHFANPESFVLKSNYGLGTDFWIPIQNEAYNGYDGHSSFDIIATQDNTAVNITPSKNIVGHIANATFTVTLNKGQTWSGLASSTSGAQHLSGSHITSDKPIAITVKDDLVQYDAAGSGYDLIGDQILPTNTLGTKYIAVKGNLANNSEKLFVTATENTTTINKNGSFVASINKGETYAIGIAMDNAVYLETSKPVAVLHLSGIDKELGAKQLSPINTSGSNEVYYQRLMNQDLYLTLVVPTQGIGSFLVNGNTGIITAAQFTQVPGNPDYWFAKIPMNSTTYPEGSVIKISNTSRFQMGALDGWIGWGQNFSYFSDFYTEDLSVEGITLKNNLKLYPNPSKALVYLEGEAIKLIEVYNITGLKLPVDVKYGKKISTIDMATFAAGNYILKASTDHANASLKLTILK
jgi:hypothetical protein